MSLDILIQIALGMLFAWLVMSIATTYLQEWVTRWMKLRPSMLEDAIRNMLSDKNMAAQFYDHPIIRGLHSGQERANKPSYLPAQQFALALFDMVKTAGTEGSLIQKGLYEVRTELEQMEARQTDWRSWFKKDNKVDATKALAEMDKLIQLARFAASTDIGAELVDAKLGELKAQITEYTKTYPQFKQQIDAAVKLAEQQARDALAVKAAGNEKIPTGNPSLDELKSSLTVLTAINPELKVAIESLIDGVEHKAGDTENEIVKARQSVEKWFDSGMERVSGWYRRETQKSALIIGIVLALVFNMDSINLVTQLWQQPALRQALSEQAAVYVNEHTDGVTDFTPTSDDLKKFEAQFSAINVPMGWIGADYPVNAWNQLVDANGVMVKTCTLNPIQPTDEYGIVAGGLCYPIINAPHFTDPVGIFLKIIGLVVSGMAAGQGAPFWFDVLRNLINFRPSGTSDKK